MNSSKNYLVALLCLTTAGLGWLAWHQYQELIALRAAVLDRNERAALQKRIWDAEKRSASLEKKLAERSKPASDTPADSDDAAAPANTFRGRRGRGAFFAMMEDPEMQKLLHVEQKAALDSRYAALFKRLNLTPEQLEKFQNLLVEKQTSMMDVFAAAREQGINPREDPEAFHKLVADAQAEVDASIKAALGDADYAQYQDYEHSMPQRNTVSQLEQRLSYSSTPLSDSQSESLVQILASTGKTSDSAVRDALRGSPGMGATTRITDATITQAQGVLAGPQLDALKALQQEQQARQQMQKAIRQQFGGGSAPAPPPGG